METAVLPQEQQAKPDLWIVTNGFSFSAAEMDPKLTELEGLDRWNKVNDRIQTTLDSSYLDEELLPRVKDGDTIVVSGGDDTVRRTLLGLLARGIDGTKNDIVITGAGGENVVAQTLHGKKHYRDPLAILESATKQTIVPTEAILSDANGTEFRRERFLFSLSMGAGAIAMRKYFNRADWRERQHQRGRAAQWIVKHLCALDTVIHAKPIQTDRGKFIDITVSGGPYSGGRSLKYDTSMSHPYENVLSLTRRSTLPITLLGRMLLPKGRALGDTWHGGYEAIRIDSRAEAQIDGNNIEDVPAGTTLRFQRGIQGVAKGIAVLALDSKYRPAYPNG